VVSLNLLTGVGKCKFSNPYSYVMKWKTKIPHEQAAAPKD
jgi:hypothetical protein